MNSFALPSFVRRSRTALVAAVLFAALVAATELPHGAPVQAVRSASFA